MTIVASPTGIGPSIEDLALARMARAMSELLDALALWCPHGHDSSRVGDYHRAREIRDFIEPRLKSLQMGIWRG